MKPVSLITLSWSPSQRARKEQDMTQQMLAEKIGYDRSYLGFLERGERNPSLEVIIKIAKALAIKPDDLLRDIK